MLSTVFNRLRCEGSAEIESRRMKQSWCRGKVYWFGALRAGFWRAMRSFAAIIRIVRGVGGRGVRGLYFLI